jgi:hypothetical protein
MGFIIIIIIIISSSTPLSSFFSHGYLCPGEAPIIDVKTPKGHPNPIQLRSIISHASQSTQSRLHTLSKKFESRNLPNYFCRLCLWSLTPTTTTAITIMIISNHKDNNNNNNPIKVG